MTQAGVLSFRYKFKVLSQDRRGNSFVALMDLTQVNGDGMASVSEMEALIVQSAAKRYDIAVSAVYWRFNEMEAVAVNRSIADAVSSVTPIARPARAASSIPAPTATTAPAMQPAMQPTNGTIQEPSSLMKSPPSSVPCSVAQHRQGQLRLPIQVSLHGLQRPCLQSPVILKKPIRRL